MLETKINEKNKGGRPRVDATPITVRVPPALLSELDSWLASNSTITSRPEAIRQLVEKALEQEQSKDTII